MIVLLKGTVNNINAHSIHSPSYQGCIQNFFSGGGNNWGTAILRLNLNKFIISSYSLHFTYILHFCCHPKTIVLSLFIAH